jgi:hypothetical protein
MVVGGGNGVDVCFGHAAFVSWGVHDFVKVADCELRSVSFGGGEAVAEVGCEAVEVCAGEVTHREDGGAEDPADLALDSVQMGVAKQTKLDGEVLANEESSNDADSVGLCMKGGGHGIDEDVVLCFSSRQCLVKLRDVLSSIPRTR